MSTNPVITLGLALVIGTAGQAFAEDTRTINVWGSEFQLPAHGPDGLFGASQTAPVTSVVSARLPRGTFTRFQNDVRVAGGHDNTPQRFDQWRSCPWC